MQSIQPRSNETHPPNIVELAAIWEAQRPQSTGRRSIERELRDTLMMYRAAGSRHLLLRRGGVIQHIS